MRSFVTGSYAYGEPREHSDLDLVVLLNHHDARELRLFHDPHDSRYGDANASDLKFNGLNLILCEDPNEFLIWKQGTEILKARRRRRGSPILREEACKTFAELRKEAKRAKD